MVVDVRHLPNAYIVNNYFIALTNGKTFYKVVGCRLILGLYSE